jgi:4'-phosphopantetheinyl transferase
LSFNLTHSHQLALYAVTRRREIGVDLEYVRADFADEQIAERFFSPREVAALRTVPENLLKEAFFHCWTRKEAYVKAKGEGLSIPLDQFDVSLAPGEPALLLSTRDDPQEADRWSLQALFPGSGYVAALAVEGRTWRLKCWQWLARQS